MNCPVCGTLLPAQAKFCSQCGAPRAVPLGSVPLRPPRPPSATHSATKWLLAGAAVVLAAAAWLALKPGALTSNGPAGSTATPDAPTDETKAAALVGPQGVPSAQVAPATPGTSAAAASAPSASNVNASTATPAGNTPAPAAASTSTATVVAPPPPVRPATAPTALSVSPTAPPSTLAPTVATKPSVAPVVTTPAVAPPPTAPRPAPKEAPTLNDLLD